MQIRHRLQSGTIGIRNKINNMATRNIYIYSFKNNTRANRLYALYTCTPIHQCH